MVHHHSSSFSPVIGGGEKGEECETDISPPQAPEVRMRDRALAFVVLLLLAGVHLAAR